MTYIINRSGMSIQLEVPYNGFSSVYTIPPNVLYKTSPELLTLIKSRMAPNSAIEFLEDEEAIMVDALTKRENIPNDKALDKIREVKEVVIEDNSPKPKARKKKE